MNDAQNLFSKCVIWSPGTQFFETQTGVVVEKEDSKLEIKGRFAYLLLKWLQIQLKQLKLVGEILPKDEDKAQKILWIISILLDSGFLKKIEERYQHSDLVYIAKNQKLFDFLAVNCVLPLSVLKRFLSKSMTLLGSGKTFRSVLLVALELGVKEIELFLPIVEHDLAEKILNSYVSESKIKLHYTLHTFEGKKVIFQNDTVTLVGACHFKCVSSLNPVLSR